MSGIVLIDVVCLVSALGLSTRGLTVALLAVPGLVALNAAGGLYRSRLSLSVLDDTPSLAARGLMALALSSALVDWWTAYEWSRNLLIATGLYTLFVVLGRAMAYLVVRLLRTSRVASRKVLVLGAGQVGRQFVSTLLGHPEFGLRPIGFADRIRGARAERLALPLLGEPHELAQLIKTHDVRHVFITFGRFRDAELVDAIRTCDRLRCEIFIIPRLFELNVPIGPGTDEIFGFPCVRVRQLSRRSVQRILKRTIDVIGAAVGLILVSPLLTACAAAVRIEMGPNVLFRQNRVGLHGRQFVLLKFCTLKPADEEESATRWTVQHDDRISAVGRFLRNTALDELPQLWNVLVGDMSMVGPRPERPHFVNQFSERFDGYSHRHRVPVGITGWAQIHGLRGDTSIGDRVRFDNQYIERWSPWQDVKILLRTAASAHCPRQARPRAGRPVGDTGIRRLSVLPPHVPRWRWQAPLRRGRAPVVRDPVATVSQGDGGVGEVLRHRHVAEELTGRDMGVR